MVIFVVEEEFQKIKASFERATLMLSEDRREQQLIQWLPLIDSLIIVTVKDLARTQYLQTLVSRHK